MEDYTVFFDYVEKYISISEADKKFLIKKTTIRNFNKGQLVLQRGQNNTYQNFIIKGCLKMYKINADGKESILTFAIENWWCGDLYSFLSKNPSKYYIEAVEDSKVIRITKKKLDDIYEEIPEFNKLFRILLQNAFIAQQERIMSNISLSAEQKYLRLREKYPLFEKRIPLKQLALYLGITPQFLSMIRKKITKKGISSTS